MTNFIRSNFEYHGGYLMYNTEDGKREFIARFKYAKQDKPGFLTFLIKNFTVEEYLGRLAADESPAPILESKGYISKTVREGLKLQQDVKSEKKRLLAERENGTTTLFSDNPATMIAIRQLEQEAV